MQMRAFGGGEKASRRANNDVAAAKVSTKCGSIHRRGCQRMVCVDHMHTSTQKTICHRKCAYMRREVSLCVVCVMVFNARYLARSSQTMQSVCFLCSQFPCRATVCRRHVWKMIHSENGRNASLRVTIGPDEHTLSVALLMLFGATRTIPVYVTNEFISIHIMDDWNIIWWKCKLYKYLIYLNNWNFSSL